MYDLLALVTGLILAVMISINGNLTRRYGVFPATVMIHVVGVLFALILCLIKRGKAAPKTHGPKWIYSGGVIGVLTTVLNNLAYGYISMTSIIALGLLGQTLTALVVDCRGFFGMDKHPVKKEALAGLAFSAAGILVMLDNSVTAAVLAVIFSFAAGISVVLSRTVNARLAQETGELQGSLINHVTGLPVSIVVALIMMKSSPPAPALGTVPVWVYTGGMMGVLVVLLCNITVPKVSAFRLTLLTFIGQLFTGIVIDCFLDNHFPAASFVGGLFIACGVILNLLLEKISADRARRDQV